MAKNKITTGNGYVQFEWGDGSRTITVNPNYVYVSLFEDTLSFTLVGVPRPTGLSLFTTRYDDFELNGSTFGSAEEALEAIQDALAKAGGTVAFEIVDELPASGNGNTFYLLRIPNPELGNIFEEYIWVENAWELVGSNGGSSIRTIYVGTSADSVDSGTCVINKVEGKKEWLNIVYVDSDGFCSMTKVNLGEFILENEFESGVTVNDDGIVFGVCDPRQEKVVVEYDASGNPSVSATVLSVNESGFTVDNIQDAIDARAELIEKVIEDDELAVSMALNDLETRKLDKEDIDDHLDIDSDNPVQNSAITKVIEDNELAISMALNDLNDSKLDKEEFEETELAVSMALNDLNTRKADWSDVVTSGDVSASTSAYTLNYTNRSGDTLFSVELPKEEGKLYKAGRAIKIESGATADTISFDLPIYSGSVEHSIKIGDTSNVAISYYSVAEGKQTQASGEASHAEGAKTRATSTASHAEGSSTQAKGSASHAEGVVTIANGGASHTEGNRTTANNLYEHASGQQNISTKETDNFGDSGNTLFSVGNGRDSRSNPGLIVPHNAFEIRQNGDIYISDVNAEGDYYNKPMIKLQDAIGGDSVKGDENTIHTEINADDEKVVSSLVYVNKITTGLPETVKERYQLVGADGNPYTTASGDTSANIDIYKDSHIVSITYITDSGDTHYQNLEYKYIDASGDTQTEYVDISELVLEVEIGDGLEVQNHIVKGKIDPTSERVVTEYTTAGTSAQTEEVLTVGENGFKASNIQLAIDTKAQVNHKLYDVVNGVYEASSHTITFVSENDDLFDTELTFDNALNSGSTNAVQNKVVKEEIEKRQIKNVELTQDEYDALVSAGTVDEETLYIISDAEPIDTSKYVTSASITSNTSAYTISFSGESGELFDVEFNKGGGLPLMEGTDIKIVSGDSFDTIYVSGDTVIDSASTRVVQSKAIAEALDTKLDKVNFLNKIYPKGSIYITESNTNPSTFIGGTWELVNVNGKKTTLWTGDTSASTTVTFSQSMLDFDLIEICGYGYYDEHSIFSPEELKRTGINKYILSGSWGSNSRHLVMESISSDFTSASIRASEMTWRSIIGINLGLEGSSQFVWKRTDDAPIAMMLETITLERGEDILWSGNTGSGTITLSAPIDDYDTIEFTIAAEGDWWQTFVTTPQILNTMTGNFMMAATWSAYDRYVSVSKPTGGTQVTLGNSHAALRYVKGIKDAYVSRTDITTEINSGSTDDKAASAKAVYDALNEIEFIEKAVTVQGGGVGAFSGTIICNADEVPLGRGSTSVQTNGAVGYGYIASITKNSDTSYTFGGWRNANGGESVTVFATFVKMPMKKR